MSFPRYPKYKDSGVEWLSDVPEHWQVIPLKRVATIRYGIGEPPRYHDGGTPLIRATNVHAGCLFADGMVFVDPSDIPEQRIVWLTAGDIIVVRSGAYTGDSAIIPDGFGPCIAGFDMVLKCHSARPRFIQFALLSNYLKEGQIDLEKMRAAQPHLNAEELGSCVLVLPDTADQTFIVEFLDRETAKIDELVAEQRRLIELLKEKRQAVISHAVTKGLDPYAPTKPSGVEWLGDVPEHWEVVPLKHLCILLKDGTHLPPGRVDEGIPLLSVRNIIDGSFVLRDDDSMISEQSYQELSRSFVPQTDDVLLAIVGATLGKTAIIPGGLGRFHVQRSLAVFRTRQEAIQAAFLNLVFQSHQFQSMLWELVGYSAQPGIYLGTLQNLRIPVPPLKEQGRLLEKMTAGVGELIGLTAEAQRAVDLLQERRTALISAAVTGKIDVRGLVETEAA